MSLWYSLTCPSLLRVYEVVEGSRDLIKFRFPSFLPSLLPPSLSLFLPSFFLSPTSTSLFSSFFRSLCSAYSFHFPNIWMVFLLSSGDIICGGFLFWILVALMPRYFNSLGVAEYDILISTLYWFITWNMSLKKNSPSSTICLANCTVYIKKFELGWFDYQLHLNFF